MPNKFNWPNIKTGSISIFRMLLGVAFLLAAVSKISAGDFGTANMLSFLEGKQPDSFPFYLTFVEQVVSTSPMLFAIGELALGISLLLGAKVRWAAPLGIFMLLNFMFAKGAYPWQIGADQIFIVLLITFFIANAGQRWGFDGYWARKAAV
jgi:uncharacterized membrane protein YphA (DoxX/SURF4 family)